MQRIFWVSPLQTTLIAAVVGFVLSYPTIGVIWVFNQLSTTPGSLTWLALIILPVAISLCASVFAALAAFTYNLIAGMGFCLVVRVEPTPVPNADAPLPDLSPPPDLSPDQFYRF